MPAPHANATGHRRAAWLLPLALYILLPLGAQVPPAMVVGAPQAESAHSPAQPLDSAVPGVINFARIDQALWRGAQPTAEGFKNLEKLGVKTVVSFRHDHDDLPLMEGTRMKYVRIPSFAFHPTEAHLLSFLKVMEDPANWPVYIHCAQGRDRTGYNAAAYRMVVQGWSADEAIREMNVFHFNKIWVGIPGFLKKVKPGALKEKLKTTPAPSLVEVGAQP